MLLLYSCVDWNIYNKYGYVCVFCKLLSVSQNQIGTAVTLMTPHVDKVIVSIAPAQHAAGCHCDGRVLLSTCSQRCPQVPQVNDAMKRTLCSYHTFPHHFKGVNQLGLTCSLNVFPWELKFYHWQAAREEHLVSIQPFDSVIFMLAVLILGVFIDFKQTSVTSLSFCHTGEKWRICEFSKNYTFTVGGGSLINLWFIKLLNTVYSRI